MRIRMPHEPKPKLLDLLKRRNQTLEGWMKDVGLADQAAVAKYCLEHQLEAPAQKHLQVNVTSPTKSVEVVKPNIPVIEEVEAAEHAVDEIPVIAPEKLNRKARRAAQKQSKEPETTGDSETPSEDD